MFHVPCKFLARQIRGDHTHPRENEKSAYRALANTRVLPPVVADPVDVDAVVMRADG